MQITPEQYTRIYAEVYSDIIGRAKWQATKYVWTLNYDECYDTIWAILKGNAKANRNLPTLEVEDFTEMFAEAWQRFVGRYNHDDEEANAIMHEMKQHIASRSALRAYMQDAVRIACYERATGLWDDEDDD